MNRVPCLFCGHDSFAEGSLVALRGITSSQPDRIAEFPNLVCDSRVCLGCGHIEWFVRNPNELVDRAPVGQTHDPEPMQLTEPPGDRYRGGPEPRTVRLLSEGPTPIAVLGVLIKNLGLSMGDARQILQQLPQTITRPTPRDARALSTALRAAGAVTNLE